MGSAAPLLSAFVVSLPCTEGILFSKRKVNSSSEAGPQILYVTKWFSEKTMVTGRARNNTEIYL